MPPPIPSPSAICTVNGNVISDVNTSGLNVPPGSTITIALLSSAGVNSWFIEASQADDLTQINGNLVAVNNSKIQTGFIATFVVPPMVEAVPALPHGPSLTRGNALQFTSTVNGGEPNEHIITFGVFVLNTFGNRLFFGSESNESNATVGNAADLNAMLTALPFIMGGDLCGLTPDGYIASISGCPYGSPVIVNTHSFLGALDGVTTAPSGSDGIDLTIATQKAVSGPVAFQYGKFNIDAYKLVLTLTDQVLGFNSIVDWAPGVIRLSETAGANQAGNSLSIFAGQPGNGAGGSINLYGGTGAVSPGGAGGSITLRGGDPGGINANGGSIDIFAPPGGVNGQSGNVTIQAYGGNDSLNGNITISTPINSTTSGVVTLSSNYVQFQGGTGVAGKGVNVLSGSSFIVDSPSTFNNTALFNDVVTLDATNLTLDSSFIGWADGTPPFFPYLTLNLSADADHVLQSFEYNHIEIVVVSSATLTMTRNLTFPLGGGGEMYVITNNTTGGQSIQVGGATGLGVVIPNGNTAWIWSNGTNYYGNTGVSWNDDLAGSTNLDQWVAAISGPGGAGGTVPLNITTLQFATGQSNPALNQASTSSASGQILTIQAQSATGATHNGGDLYLASGASGSATVGTVRLRTDSTDRLLVSPTNITIPAFSTAGVVHNDASGNLSTSLIVDADIDPTADIDVTKIAHGTAGQLLLTNATPVNAWTTMGGDAIISATGSVTVTGLQTNPVTPQSLGPDEDGYVLTWDDLDGYWKGLPPTVAFMAGCDLSGTSTCQTVIAVQGNAYKTETPGASQDGYVPTWVESNNRFEILPQTGSGGGGGGGVTTVGTFDFQPPNANGLAIVSTSIYAQSADATHPGMVSTGTQTFAGDKTLSGATTLSALSTGIVHSGSGGALTSSLILNADVDAAAAIVYSKLNLTGGIVDADVNASAAIAGSKITPNFGSQALTAGQSVLGTTTAANTLAGSLTVTTRAVSGALTIDTTTTDFILLVDTSATRNITFPAPTNGRIIVVKDKTGTCETNNITMVRNGSEKIDGLAASRVLNTNWGYWTFTSDGVDWFQIG
jgi:hypothetical protein